MIRPEAQQASDAPLPSSRTCLAALAFAATLGWPAATGAETAAHGEVAPAVPPAPAASADGQPAGAVPSKPAEVQLGGLRFEPFHDRSFVSARKSGSPVVLYFEAEWCVPCKEMHDRTFAEASVVSAASGFRLFRVDLSAPNPQNELLKKTFRVVGAPTLILFAPGGKESGRRFGFVPAADFTRMLDESRKQAAES